jgi:alpha-L-fucosidase 2
MHHSENISNYKRELSLDTAIHKVSYACDNINFERKTFISHKHQVLCIDIVADKLNSVSFTAQLNGKLKCEKEISDEKIAVFGNCPVCKAPYGQTHNSEDKKIYSENPSEKGVGYFGAVSVKINGGSLKSDEKGITVTNADTATIYFAIRTSFNGFDKHPVLKGKEYKEKCIADIKKAKSIDLDEILKDTVKEHKKLYNRVVLSLGEKESKEPTDERLYNLQQGKTDNGIYVLLFNFGRYLSICGSRKGAQPTNLQGIWNEKTLPAWSSNYTLNINAHMLGCNLRECALPLNKMIKELCKNGKKTALQYYGANGSVCHHASDLWRLTHPSTNLLKGSCQWGFWNMSGGWLASHLFEYYKYTLDKRFLKNEALPVMREFATFYSELLIEDENKELILSPSTSPENSFIYKGEKISIAKTTTMTMAIIRELFSNYKIACETLGLENSFYYTICEQLPKLKGYNISKDGRLCEWDKEYNEFEITHRHLSHLYGLFPGNEITTDKTPELATACSKTLLKRGDEGTGWSLAWKINFWARLQNGEKALKLLRRHLKPVESSNEDQTAGGGSYINLMCAAPPFCIDGNFGATSGILQMLLQCDGENINLLPALPKEWSNGNVKGMCIHGGATIDFTWKNGKVTSYKIKNNKGNNYEVRTF